MGWLLTAIALGVLVLAIIGIGVVPFFRGVYNGAQVIVSNPMVHRAVQQVQTFFVQHLSNVLPH
ncbi:MAG: hypothetical protein ABI361_09135 [Nitrososphaera sp.]